MNVLVDTSVWSLALRRGEGDLSLEKSRAVRTLAGLVEEARVAMTGPIRQEILSGIPDVNQFARIRERLRAFDDLPITGEDHEHAAEFFNTCRSRGVQGSHTDFLICAVASRYNLPIFTLDKDFAEYARHLPVSLVR